MLSACRRAPKGNLFGFWGSGESAGLQCRRFCLEDVKPSVVVCVLLVFFSLASKARLGFIAIGLALVRTTL